MIAIHVDRDGELALLPPQVLERAHYIKVGPYVRKDARAAVKRPIAFEPGYFRHVLSGDITATCRLFEHGYTRYERGDYVHLTKGPGSEVTALVREAKVCRFGNIALGNLQGMALDQNRFDTLRFTLGRIYDRVIDDDTEVQFIRFQRV